MKSQRHKQIRSNYDFFARNFDFKPPQKLLIDGNFLKICVDTGFNYYQRLHSILDSKLEFYTTACVQHELRIIGPALEKVLQKSYSLKRLVCNHEGQLIAPSQCLKATIGRLNEGQYIVASQDPDVWSFAGKIVNLPVLHFLQNILRMKPPIDLAVQMVDKKNVKKMQLSDVEKKEIRVFSRGEIERVRKIKKEKLKNEMDKLCVKTKKKWGNPNPLSCKKKKVKKVRYDKVNNELEK